MTLTLDLLYDNRFYFLQYSDIATAVGNGTLSSGIAHFLRFGSAEGRNPSPLFDNAFYLQQNQDVAAAVAAGTFSSGLAHYLQFGASENRSASRFFNSRLYLERNTDVAAAVATGTFSSAIEHYLKFGFFERRIASFEASYTTYSGLTVYGSVSSSKQLTGSLGSDLIYAATSGSSIFATDGADILVGGGGNDAMVGGLGSDEFVFEASSSITTDIVKGGYGGADVISDFEAESGSPDIIKLKSLDRETVINITTETSGNTLIQITGSAIGNTQTINQSIRIQGISAATFLAQAKMEVNGLKVSDTTAGLSKTPFGFTYVVGAVPGNSVFGTSGDDTIALDSPQFSKTTNNDDFVSAGAGNDYIDAGGGDDLIFAGAGTDTIIGGPGEDFIVGKQGQDYFRFNNVKELFNASGSAVVDRVAYTRFGDTGNINIDEGPDIIQVSAEGFNQGADSPGKLVPGTIISGDNTGTAATLNGQLFVGFSIVPSTLGPAENDAQPTFYYGQTTGGLFFDRDGIATKFGFVHLADLSEGISLFPGTPLSEPTIIIQII